MSNISRLSLANRAVVALITLIIGVFGLLSVGNLKQELIPSIEIPSAAIVTSYAGASPEVVDSQVSVIIENAVIGLRAWNQPVSHLQPVYRCYESLSSSEPAHLMRPKG